MYNFNNLSDFEFEILCKDIMEKKLGISLRIFGKGRDGGIDLTDDCINKNIVIQVKHYINSTFSNLKSSLQNEVNKVNIMKPKQYYICCAKSLSPNNTVEIYNMFSKYMDSDRNIISLNDINEFLENPQNISIVRKNYKLWLQATNILSEIYNQSVFIDCEALLYNIESDSKAFVETECYRQCRKILLEDRIVFLIGSPGVGKTITTKMIALYFASIGYRIRYTTNGDIKDLKNSISSDKELKEVILLDDCLGQHYFNMKETQGNELLSLIKYILMNPNKMLILNSRVTIFNEAKERYNEFNMFVEDKKVKLHVIDMNEVSIADKGLILYNHLFHKNVPSEYYNNILKNKKYVKIVKHNNYTPRIIEFVTRKVNYERIDANDYAKFILGVLDYPNGIWEEEFNRRLQKEDRIFMTTLYSLTDTTISLNILRRAYNYRLYNSEYVDTTINIFDNVLSRMSNSLVIIYDKNGEKEVGVINPSVNDYLKGYIESNELEIKSIVENITEYCQVKRFLRDKGKENQIIEMMKNGEMLEINYLNKVEKVYVIISYICKYEILREDYEDIIGLFLNDLSYGNVEGMMNRSEIVSSLLKEPFFSYYHIEDYFQYEACECFFEDMGLDEIYEFFSEIGNDNVSKNFIKDFKDIIKDSITRAISEYSDEIDENSFFDTYDITPILDECRIKETYGWDFDYNRAITIISNWLKNDIYDEILERINIIPTYIRTELNVEYECININEESIEAFINSYLEPDGPDYDDYEGHNYSVEEGMDILDVIFK